MDFRLLSSTPRQDLWRWLVVGDAVKTQCDERVAQRCGERARLAPVQKHERERGMFLRLHHEIPGMRIGVENGFGKSGKQRIEDKASKTSRTASRQDSSSSRASRSGTPWTNPIKIPRSTGDADGCRDADAAVELVKGARIPQIRRLSDKVDFAE
jgi:hypothetical protein